MGFGDGPQVRRAVARDNLRGRRRPVHVSLYGKLQMFSSYHQGTNYGWILLAGAPAQSTGRNTNRVLVEPHWNGLSSMSRTFVSNYSYNHQRVPVLGYNRIASKSRKL